MSAQEPAFAPIPATAQGCRERLVELQGEIASIKTQIATADIARQAKRTAIDPQWFHRVKTALRFKQQEVARINAHITAHQNKSPREGFKDTLIEVLRELTPNVVWQSAMTIARQRHDREVQHG